MSRIQGKNTGPEIFVRSLLHRMGYRFRLHVKALPGKPDIVLPGYRAVVFVHGCFWHRHRGCRNCTVPTNRRKFWIKKLETNAVRDSRNEAALRRAGWRVIVVWECEVEKRERIAQRLARLLGEGRAREAEGKAVAFLF